MNRLKGNISAIESDGQLSLVEVKLPGGDRLHTIIIEKPAKTGYLKEENNLELLFKETEVAVALESAGISLQNKLSCTVKAVNQGKLLSEVKMDYKGNKITAVITSRAVEQLKLKEGLAVFALIKTNEITVAPCP